MHEGLPNLDRSRGWSYLIPDLIPEVETSNISTPCEARLRSDPGIRRRTRKAATVSFMILCQTRRPRGSLTCAESANYQASVLYKMILLRANSVSKAKEWCETHEKGPPAGRMNPLISMRFQSIDNKTRLTTLVQALHQLRKIPTAVSRSKATFQSFPSTA